MLRENAALMSMYLLGILLTSFLGWPLGLLYLVYCLASNLLYMAWTCPYCPHYAAASCPAGYHLLSGRRFRPQPGKTFKGQFQRSVILLAPGWFVPPLMGGYVLITDFSWLAMGLLLAFCAVGFLLLPVDSRRHCQGCVNRECPRWKASRP
jgi:hypothetical protein